MIWAWGLEDVPVQKFFANLFGEVKTEDKPLDTRIASVALLVHMMLVDGKVSKAESDKLDALVREHFAKTEDEATRLIAHAKAADARAVDLYSFTQLLKTELPEEERIHIVELLWDMVYADGQLHEFEDNMVWRISELLAVDPKDRIAMKQKARGEALMQSDAAISEDEE